MSIIALLAPVVNGEFGSGEIGAKMRADLAVNQNVGLDR
jgi:hypothetical protein